MIIADPFAVVALGPGSNGMLMTPEEFDGVDEWDELYRFIAGTARR